VALSEKALQAGVRDWRHRAVAVSRVGWSFGVRTLASVSSADEVHAEAWSKGSRVLTGLL